ncbi:MAG TPA: SufD family Fe-S cluster assembly protein [Candidatus Babeliales bacterium]|nr:SufD family Fe-S cluster assembly protein [Candidatus Babeliales bacterium]
MVCEYIVGENQHKKYVFLIDEGSAMRDKHIRFCVERNAALVVEILVVHADVHVNIDCILQGEGADARIVGAYIGSASHRIQITSFQHHQVPHTSSVLVMRGALYGSAQAQYHGTIRVDKKACGTNASQENKNMLLSNNARALSVPNLEVLTNDVKCFHASAIGRFDDEQLFYAASRGIDEKTAQQLLLNAFFADLFVSDELREKLSEIIG